jgi:hypothetical protein
MTQMRVIAIGIGAPLGQGCARRLQTAGHANQSCRTQVTRKHTIGCRPLCHRNAYAWAVDFLSVAQRAAGTDNITVVYLKKGYTERKVFTSRRIARR